MAVVALVGNKGGAGKTTLCVNLASALAEKAPTVVLDADPQRSSLQWREIADRADAVPVIDAVDDLADLVRESAPDYDFVVIDCPPSVHSSQTRAALERCDLALIPVQPSPLDLWATTHIEDEVKVARATNPELRAVLVINQLEPRTRLSQMVRRGLSELGLPTAESAVRRRVAFRSSALEGRSVLELGSRGKAAAQDIRELIDEVFRQ